MKTTMSSLFEDLQIPKGMHEIEFEHWQLKNERILRIDSSIENSFAKELLQNTLSIANTEEVFDLMNRSNTYKLTFFVTNDMTIYKEVVVIYADGRGRSINIKYYKEFLRKKTI